MADPRQVIRILRYRGVTVRLDGDRLVAAPRHLLDAELRTLIARFKPELIAHLEAQLPYFGRDHHWWSVRDCRHDWSGRLVGRSCWTAYRQEAQKAMSSGLCYCRISIEVLPWPHTTVPPVHQKVGGPRVLPRPGRRQSKNVQEAKDEKSRR